MCVVLKLQYLLVFAYRKYPRPLKCTEYYYLHRPVAVSIYLGTKSLAHRARALPIICPRSLYYVLRSVLTSLSHHPKNQLHLRHQTLSEGFWFLAVQTETSLDLVPLGSPLRRDEVDMDHAEPNTRSAIATI